MAKDQDQLAFARRLRQQSTYAERLLWAKLRRKYSESVKFKREQPIGAFVVDFVSFEKNLVVEIDGGQHAEAETSEKDIERTKWLEGHGYRVLRFWDNDVLTNVDGMVEVIMEALFGNVVSPSL